MFGKNTRESPGKTVKAKLQEYALIADIIGGIAIVASLIFVGVQLQQNTIATQGNTRNELIAADLTVLLSPNAAKIAVNMRSPEPITDEEVLEVLIYLTAVLRVREFVWLQYRSGLIDVETWRAYLSGITVNFNNPRARMFWDLSKTQFDPEFVAEVDKILADIPPVEIYYFDMDAMKTGKLP